jgi:adenosylcobinamide kinase/adenosylcobinamide-phosphate guanylyltransferase
MAELILGGQRSGKTARAESLAAQWLAQPAQHKAVYIATARALDDEMRLRVDRHRQDRAARVPRMVTVEEPVHLVQAIQAHAAAGTLVVVDCLTLWLANVQAPGTGLVDAVSRTGSPLILISNEIGMGVIPLGSETRAYVDMLGRLNQQLAAVCERVTLMVAGLPLVVKGGA